MGADMALVIVEVLDSISYDKVKKRINALSDDVIDIVIMDVFGYELKDLSADNTHQGFAMRQLTIVMDKNGTVSRAIWMGPIGSNAAYAESSTYMIAGGMSWGEVSEEYDALNFLNELEVMI